MLSYSAVGREIGISKQAVHKAVKQGMPVTSIEAVKAWRAKNIDPGRQSIDSEALLPGPSDVADDLPASADDSGLRHARIRHVTANAQIAELELETRKRDLLSLRNKVLPTVQDLVFKICSQLDNLPHRAAPELSACVDAWECEKVLKLHADSIRQVVRSDLQRAIKALESEAEEPDDEEDDDDAEVG